MSDPTWPYSTSTLSLIREIPTASLSEGYTLAWFGPGAFTSLLESWQENVGVYLFLKAEWASISPSTLEAQLRAYLKEPAHQLVRFLWIENPAAGLIEWKSNAIAVEAVEAGRQVSSLTYIGLRNYAFSLARYTRVALDGPGAPTGFIFTRQSSNDEGFELSAGYGAHRFYQISDTVSLPMQGDSSGCLQFGFHVEKEGSASTTFGYPGFEKLDAGIRLFMRDPDFPEAGSDYFLSSHRYPLFQESSAVDEGYAYYREAIGFQASLDPIYPLHAERTYFAFEQLELTDEFIEIGFPSGYMTNLGYDVHLLPLAASKLVLALRPATLTEKEQNAAPFYLVPSGRFSVKVPIYHDPATWPGPDTLVVDLAAEANVICGVSGLEYLKVSSDSILIFTPGQPAYAPAYVSVQSLLRDLTTILESYSARSLPTDTTDLDMKIEDKEEGEAEEALGITDTERLEMLEIIRQDYFPPDYTFTSAAIAEYSSLEIVEELVDWLQSTLQSVKLSDTEGKKALEAYPTTAWAYVEEPGGAVYYAQPDQAVLYRAEDSSKAFLDYMEVPSVGLPTRLENNQTAALEKAAGFPTLAFPMLPYGNVDPYRLTDMLQLEILLVNNYRRNRIQEISAATAHSIRLTDTEATAPPTGTTPQGLLATYSTDYRTISTLQLAKDTKNKLVQFVNIPHGSSLKASLQSNQLFMVMTDPGSVAAYFSTEILSSIPNAANAMDIQDWIFELGAGHWNKKGTIFIFKFHDKPLLDLAAQPELWSLPDEYNTDKEETSQILAELLREAVETGKSTDKKERRKYELLARAATQANWTGILALNVDVPLRNLPDQLKALAGGMDPDKFYAQYIGVEVTPVKSTGTALDSQQSSLFGLIDYKNPAFPSADASGYNFHVPYLTVVFQNSEIVAFAAEILILMDLLFDERTNLLNSPTGQNVMTLKGVAEEHDGKVTYSFGFSGENVFQLSGKVVEELEIVKAQFATDPIVEPAIDLPLAGTVSGAAGSSNVAGAGTHFRAELGAGHKIKINGVIYTVASVETDEALTLSASTPLGAAANGATAFVEQAMDITGRFFFWGRMRFAYNHKFDILSFGKTPGIAEADAPERDYLNLSNLQITMAFKLHAETYESSSKVTDKFFEFKPEQLAFDLAQSGWRRQSLYEKFPLKFSSFKTVKGDANALSKSGFMPVKSPLTSAELGDTWYGMAFELNLGSTGALAGSAGLAVSILAAWAPEQEGVYVGLKLPGSTGGKKEITIQGLLKIAFKSIQFVIYPLDAAEDATLLTDQTEREVGYLLKLKNIVLKFFVLSFPPSGQTEIIIFGDPREVDRKDKLVGWYAAYAKK